ncbi:MAG: hypothetical protein NC251_13725 [Lachnoclostridium sp.]|nr:hypothetical protein [Lachnospira sp.]MCM1249465.1 hypothetical protein [Lachnoclostridium sp.]MCM1536265.1 hypothetical protein [Clostridium sp.]
MEIVINKIRLEMTKKEMRKYERNPEDITGMVKILQQYMGENLEDSCFRGETCISLTRLEEEYENLTSELDAIYDDWGITDDDCECFDGYDF